LRSLPGRPPQSIRLPMPGLRLDRPATARLAGFLGLCWWCLGRYHRPHLWPMEALMPIPALVEGLFGLGAAYVGIRFMLARRIPIVHEGGTEPVGWIEGAGALVLGAVTAGGGLAMLAEALGWFHLGLR